MKILIVNEFQQCVKKMIFTGEKNFIRGEKNFIRGENNFVRGEKNFIRGENNFVRGEENLRFLGENFHYMRKKLLRKGKIILLEAKKISPAGWEEIPKIVPPRRGTILLRRHQESDLMRIFKVRRLDL